MMVKSERQSHDPSLFAARQWPVFLSSPFQTPNVSYNSRNSRTNRREGKWPNSMHPRTRVVRNAQVGGAVARLASPSDHYQLPRPVDGELGFDEVETQRLYATSAASSLALFRCLPSYQKRAAWLCPLTCAILDHAVRPPARRPVSHEADQMEPRGLPRRSETI